MKTNMHFGAAPGVFRQAQLLRNNHTKAESFLWQYLRKNQLKYRFRRQHPIWKYVVDFYCHPLRLIIEIDGGIHEEPETQSYDEERNQDLTSLGLSILRFSNEQVLFDIDSVWSEINHTIDKLKYRRLTSPTIKSPEFDNATSMEINTELDKSNNSSPPFRGQGV